LAVQPPTHALELDDLREHPTDLVAMGIEVLGLLRASDFQRSLESMIVVPRSQEHNAVVVGMPPPWSPVVHQDDERQPSAVVLHCGFPPD
jgi:hypothetical protein